jgi:hypothetical protein
VNMTPRSDVEVTHVWYQNGSRVEILSRPLPVRLRPSETWETCVPTSNIPDDADVFHHFHALISTGEEFASVHNRDVPPAGYVAGQPLVPKGRKSFGVWVIPLFKISRNALPPAADWPSIMSNCSNHSLDPTRKIRRVAQVER